MRRSRNQYFAAQMAALLFRRQLVLEMNARSAGLDKRLHDLEGVERAAEACLRIGNDRRKPCLDRKPLALGRLDLVGALQCTVDPAREFRRGIGRIKRLVGIHGRRGIAVRRHLPAGEIDRLQPSAHLLHRLIASHGAERIDEILAFQKLPQPVCTLFRQRITDLDRAAQPLHILSRIGAGDPVEPAFRRIGNELVKICHLSLSHWF
ncbi:hypothetical protein D3C80_293580 [compost metagenome]